VSEPKRYDLFVEASLQAEEGGEWVKWEDYCDLKEQVERLTKAGDELGEWFMDIHPSKKKWNAAKEGKQS
jgi:hypothetical protein